MTAPEPSELPAPPPLPTIPPLTDVPRDSAVDTVRLAADLLAVVQKWAPDAVAAVDFMGAAELRRHLAPVASTIARRGLSKEAALDAQHAVRLVERVIGLTVRRGQELGLVRPWRQGNHSPGVATRDIGADVTKAYRLADVTDAEFDAAVQRGRDRGSLAYDHLVGHLGVEHLTDVQREQRDRIVELAADRYSTRQIAAAMELGPRRLADLARQYGIDIPGDAGLQKTRGIDPIRVITESIPTLDGVGSACKQVDLTDVAALDAAQAKDWAAQMWAALTPIMALRAALRNRGKEA